MAGLQVVRNLVFSFYCRQGTDRFFGYGEPVFFKMVCPFSAAPAARVFVHGYRRVIFFRVDLAGQVAGEIHTANSARHAADMNTIFFIISTFVNFQLFKCKPFIVYWQVQFSTS